MGIKKYWNNTKTPLYSFFFSIPLFIIYEIGIFLSSSSALVLMRNGADALMRQVLSALGINGFHWMGGIFFFGFILTYFYQKQFWRKIEIEANYFGFMFFESCLWSIGLYYFMSNVHILLMVPNGSFILQQVALAVGAGIYEEFLFRVLLISSIGGVLGFIFQWSHNVKKFTAMIIAAGIFSAFHFIGEFGDYFSFNVFMVRFLAGTVLGVLYFLRGFGIVAWTHSVYDLIILTRISTQ